MRKKNVPTVEEFRHAEKLDRERNKGLSQIRENIKRYFEDNGVCETFVFYSRNHNVFVAYIFFRLEQQIEEAEKAGITSKIRDVIFDELERAGRGERNTIKVDFEFDSHENVEQNYEGDYYLRLR